MSKCNWKHWDLCRKSIPTGDKQVRCLAERICEHKVTLPDAPVPTCPKCGSSIGQNKMGDGHWHCRNLSCTWKQPDYEQRPKIPKPMKGRHAGEYRQPLDGEVVFYQDCNGEWRLSHPCSVLNYGEKDKRWIAVKDAVPAHPSGCTCPACFLARPDVDVDAPVPEKVIEPLGNYPDMKLMRDKINEIVEWSREVSKWINDSQQRVVGGKVDR